MATYPYLSPTGWFTEAAYQMYEKGCLTGQPNVEPGSQFFDPTVTTVLDYMTAPTPVANRFTGDSQTDETWKAFE